MLVGAFAGFVIGGILGLSSVDFASPIVSPLLGATVGVALGWLPFAYGAGARRRRVARELELAHERLRVEAHRGWVDDVDMARAMPRPDVDAPAPPTRTG
jgi:hypothetical protein